jgi:hypothetical protein
MNFIVELRMIVAETLQGKELKKENVSVRFVVNIPTHPYIQVVKSGGPQFSVI